MLSSWALVGKFGFPPQRSECALFLRCATIHCVGQQGPHLCPGGRERSGQGGRLAPSNRARLSAAPFSVHTKRGLGKLAPLLAIAMVIVVVAGEAQLPGQQRGRVPGSSLGQVALVSPLPTLAAFLPSLGCMTSKRTNKRRQPPAFHFFPSNALDKLLSRQLKPML